MALRQSLARGGVGFGTAAWGNNPFCPFSRAWEICRKVSPAYSNGQAHARTRKTFAKVHAIGGVYPPFGRFRYFGYRLTRGVFHRP